MPNRDELRIELSLRRGALGPAERQAKSDAIWKRLAGLPVFREAKLALFYVTHGAEVDTAMMRRLSRELGLAVGAPRSRPGDKSMRFHRLDSDDGLVPGPYGILQPGESAPLVDLRAGAVVLVPGLAFDRRGNRLGFGTGYYDRWLAAEGRGLPTVGLAFAEQLVDLVPAMPHDIPVHAVVTDRESVDCRLGGPR